MDMRATVTGVPDVMAALRAAFPNNVRRQRSLLNQSMRAAAMKTIMPDAQLRAARIDGSGSLSAALGIRYQKQRSALTAGSVAGIYITPIRRDPTAIAKYISYYKANSATVGSVAKGIYHGHFIEFGHKAKDGSFVAAQPFLWPAAQSKMASYKVHFTQQLGRKVELAVRRRARKARKK